MEQSDVRTGQQRNLNELEQSGVRTGQQRVMISISYFVTADDSHYVFNSHTTKRISSLARPVAKCLSRPRQVRLLAGLKPTYNWHVGTLVGSQFREIWNILELGIIQDDKKGSMHLMIIVQKSTQ
jgi:hypothetical protein